MIYRLSGQLKPIPLVIILLVITTLSITNITMIFIYIVLVLCYFLNGYVMHINDPKFIKLVLCYFLNGFFNFLSNIFMMISHLSSWLKLSFKNKKDMLIKAQNMVIMECMSENVLSILQNHSDSIMSGLTTIGLLGLGVGTSYALYKRRSVSKEKNDNNDDPFNISSENSNFVDNRENINSVDEAANNNDGCSKDEFSNIESLDPCKILKSVESKLESSGWWSHNEEFPVEQYESLIEDLCYEMCGSRFPDISEFLKDFNIEGAVEYFSNALGNYSENVINLINVEGAVEYFSLLRLSQFAGKDAFLNYGPLPDLFVVVFALTLVRMIKKANLPKELYSMKKKLSLAKINFLSKFSIKDYFHLFKESFLSIIFSSLEGSLYHYCPKYNGVRIIEKVIFNESNIKFFFDKGKFSQFMNKKSDFCTRRASRAYWLDPNHSIFDVYNTVCFDFTVDNLWCYVEKSHCENFVYDRNINLNTDLCVEDYFDEKSPYIIFLFNYVLEFRSSIIQSIVEFENENEKNIDKLYKILNGEEAPISIL